VQPIHIRPYMPTGRVDLRARAEASICIAICFTGLYACGSGRMQFRLVRIGLLSNSSLALNVLSECLRTRKFFFETQRNCKHFDSLPESVPSHDNKPARHDDKPVHKMCFTGLYACGSGRMPMITSPCALQACRPVKHMQAYRPVKHMQACRPVKQAYTAHEPEVHAARAAGIPLT
jgi:hypothetical protein